LSSEKNFIDWGLGIVKGIKSGSNEINEREKDGKSHEKTNE